MIIDYTIVYKCAIGYAICVTTSSYISLLILIVGDWYELVMLEVDIKCGDACEPTSTYLLDSQGLISFPEVFKT